MSKKIATREQFMLKWFIVCWSLFIVNTAVSEELNGLKEIYERPETVPFPDNNPYSSVKAALGKMLFFDPRVSRDQNMNCASCHNPSFGWETPTSKSLGAQAVQLPRHSPTTLNMAWLEDAYFWDGRATTLEEQAKGPIENPLEMNFTMPELVERLKKVEGYRYWFDKAFPSEGLNSDTILKAIATFERTIISTESPFDKWVKGDETAISDQAKKGFEIYNGKAKCVACHQGWNFTDNQFHDIGLPDEEDEGRYIITGDSEDLHAFKTPTLRDITQRAPFMHDGSIEDLDAVVEHYNQGGVKRDSLSPFLTPLNLTQQEKDALVAFMKTLTGPDMIVSLPVLPN